MPELTYRIYTYGCQMNKHDSEVLAGLLEASGYAEAPEDVEAPDVVLVNTCAVRQHAEERVFGQLGRLSSIKKANPSAILGICGCMAQEHGDQIMKRVPSVDLVLGTHRLAELPRLLSEIQCTGERRIEVSAQDSLDLSIHPRSRSGHHAWVSVMRGCDNYCAYCIVPYVRGHERSRPIPKVVDEVARLAGEGVVEVTLLGQNIMAYGKRGGGEADFVDLLQAVHGVEGIRRIRFATSHPRDVSSRLISAIADLPKVCEHLHLPVQHGSSRILAAMNRGYTRGAYLDIVERLRRRVPTCSLMTDAIVGFPGETDADFADLFSLFEEVRFDLAFMFKYSPRQGTRAAELPGAVPEPVKQQRLEALIDLQRASSLGCNEAEVGAVQEILVDGPTQRGQIAGRNRGYKVVLIEGGSPEPGEFVRVQITQARAHSLTGRLQESAA